MTISGKPPRRAEDRAWRAHWRAGWALVCLLAATPASGIAESRAAPPDPAPPVVSIEGVTVDGERLPAAAVPRVPPGAGRVEIHYAAHGLDDPTSVRFRYRLEGVDTGWVEAGSRRIAAYAGLRPGKYRFAVQLSRVEGKWSRPGAVLNFEFEPRFYETWWFRLSCVVELILLTGFLLVYRTRSLVRRNLELRARVEERTASLARANEELNALVRQLEENGRELEEAKAAAEEASRLKSEFLANVSHEIRTPMNAVLGLTSLVMDTNLTGEQREDLETVQAAAEGLLNLLNQVLEFSRLEAGCAEIRGAPFSPESCVAGAVRTLEASVRRKGLAIGYTVEAHGAWLGDEARLRQVLLNLISNAVKFTDRGWIDVRAGEEAGGGALRFSVEDSGIGIPAEKQAAVFERFRQVDGSAARAHGGAGLGLAISARLVELMGGRIWLESEEGRGSCFHFTVSCRRVPDGGGQRPKPRLPAGDSAAPARVLVAEDNAVNQLVIRRLLEKEGHQVRLAASGLEAFETAREGAFDLILMDLQMPDLDGLEATRRIRALPPPAGRVPIYALTAHAVAGDVERCLAAGMDGYLSKPVDRRELRRVIRNVVHAGRLG